MSRDTASTASTTSTTLTKPPPTLSQLPKHTRKLMNMLMFKRPANSKTEAIFCKRYLMPAGARPDAHGNYWLVLPGNDDILFSSHTDTVHKTPGTQQLLYGGGLLSAKESNCLGADCGVGVWLMLEMVKAKVPGTYIWHAEEEIGGKGSDYIAKNMLDKIQNKKFAIAFDRSGTDEIITHQFCGRTASDAFASSLAAILHPLKYEKSEYGSFTDTANYAGIIPECTNLSVGYYKQHQTTEHLDIPHAMALRAALCAADWPRLVASRDPSVKEPRVYAWAKNRYDDSKWWQDETTKKWHYGDKPKTNYGAWWERALAEHDAANDTTTEDLSAYVKREHEAVADFLEHNGFTKSDIEDYIWTQSGVT